jgi:cysteine desulfurase
MARVYLDHNATTPLRPEAADAVMGVLRDDWGNPSSVHWAGAAARERVAEARGRLAHALRVRPDALIFTSGATESINTVLRGASLAGGEIVTCASEHAAALEVCALLRAQGVRIALLPVERDGRLDPDRFAAALGPDTALASVMWVNNETGVVQPIAELAARARARGVPFHTDAVQALGKLPLDLEAVPVDYASFSAHKLGGPKGAGALYARPGARLTPLLAGGPQERRRRAGTENVAGIAGLGAAAAAATADLAERTARLAALRDRLWAGIQATVPDVHVNGAGAPRVANTLNVAFAGADGAALVEALDLEGIAVAGGSACASGSAEPSHVLAAMGVPPEQSLGAVRFSLGRESSAEDVERVLAVLPGLVARVRGAARVAWSISA